MWPEPRARGCRGEPPRLTVLSYKHNREREVAVGFVEVQYVPRDRLELVPTCGLNHLPRDIAFGKLSALARGAEIVRREMGVVTAAR